MNYLTIFSKHFWPENFKINDIAFSLKKKYSLNVFAAKPNHSNIKYKSNLSFRRYKNININYFYSYGRRNNKFFSISLNYISYILNLSLQVFFFIKK